MSYSSDRVSADTLKIAKNVSNVKEQKVLSVVVTDFQTHSPISET